MGIPRICNLFFNFAYGCIRLLNQIYLTTLKAVIAHYHSSAIVTKLFSPKTSTFRDVQ